MDGRAVERCCQCHAAGVRQKYSATFPRYRDGVKRGTSLHIYRAPFISPSPGRLGRHDRPPPLPPPSCFLTNWQKYTYNTLSAAGFNLRSVGQVDSS